MNAKETLNEIRRLGIEIDAMQEHIEQLRGEAEGLRAVEITDMPKGGGKARDAADLIAEVVDLQNKRLSLILDRMTKREHALFIIACIDNCDYRSVLLMRYIMCLSWDAIVDRLKYSYTSVFRLHGAALQAFEAQRQKLGVNGS